MCCRSHGTAIPVPYTGWGSAWPGQVFPGAERQVLQVDEDRHQITERCLRGAGRGHQAIRRSCCTTGHLSSVGSGTPTLFCPAGRRRGRRLAGPGRWCLAAGRWCLAAGRWCLAAGRRRPADREDGGRPPEELAAGDLREKGSVGVHAEQVLLGEQLVQPGLVDPADDGRLFLPVADALGQRERRGDGVEDADGEEGAEPGSRPAGTRSRSRPRTREAPNETAA